MSHSTYVSPTIAYTGVVTINPHWETEVHIQPVWKLYWNADDGAALELDGRRMELEAGCLYLIAPLTQYRPFCPAEVRHFYVHFYMPSEYALMPPGIWRIGAPPYDWNQLADQVTQGAADYTQRAKVIALVCHAVSSLPASLFKEEHRSPLQDVYLWIDKHLEGDCSNESLTGISGYSPDTLNRYFHRETGMSPQSYVRRLRISKGAVLLRQTNKGVDEIAEICGFCNRAHFHRAFRERTGVTPIEFRKGSRP